MAGNLAEWTAQSGSITRWGGFQVVKGGSFAHGDAVSFRCSARVEQPPGNGPTGVIGFRCAMYSPDGPHGAASVVAARRTYHSNTLPLTRPELHLEEPILLVVDPLGRRRSVILYLPDEGFVLNIPASIVNPADPEHGKAVGNQASRFQFSEDSRVASNRWCATTCGGEKLEV